MEKMWCWLSLVMVFWFVGYDGARASRSQTSMVDEGVAVETGLNTLSESAEVVLAAEQLLGMRNMFVVDEEGVETPESGIDVSVEWPVAFMGTESDMGDVGGWTGNPASFEFVNEGPKIEDLGAWMAEVAPPPLGALTFLTPIESPGEADMAEFLRSLAFDFSSHEMPEEVDALFRPSTPPSFFAQ